MISRRKTALILLLEGFVSSALQMITIRQTMPFVGSSVLCTSIVISCFLGALALGYYIGGKQSPHQFKQVLLRNLIISLGFFGIGLSYLFVEIFFTIVGAITKGNVIFSSPLIHLLSFCLLIMSPLVFCLGQTVPLLLNTWNENVRKSEAAGNATAISTLGNVVGCLVCSLVLMYFLGIGYSIIINCTLLLICIFTIAGKDILCSPVQPLITLILFSTLTIFNAINERERFITTTAYSNISITQSTAGKELIINRSRSSYVDQKERKGWPYIELIKTALFENLNPGGRVLVLGAGGFTLSAENTHGLSFTYVDIESKLQEISEAYFLQRKINGEFVAQDARSYLIQNEKQWDAIVIDLYSNSATIPAHTSTAQFFNLVNSRLKKNGLVIMNIVANPMLSDDFSRNIDFTIRGSLSRCVNDLTSFSDDLVNMIYYCHPFTSSSRTAVATTYNDDSTKVTIDSYIMTLRNKR